MTIYAHLLIRLNNFNKRILVETGKNEDKKKTECTNMPKHTHAYSHTHIYTLNSYSHASLQLMCTPVHMNRKTYMRVCTAIFMSKHRYMQIQITYA